MIEGAVILLVGILVGRFLPGRRRKPKEPKPVCGCDHSLAMHDPETGVCHAVWQSSRRTGTDDHGYGIYEHDQLRCPCKQYTGPKPIESFFSTPMLPPSV